MAEALSEPAPSAARERPLVDGASYAEQRLFSRSPLNTWLTAATLFAVLLALYAASAAIDGGLAPDREAWVAAVLTLILCSNLALQRFSRQRDLVDAPRYSAALSDGLAWEASFDGRRLRLFTLIGVVTALALSALFFVIGRHPGGMPGARTLWFALVSVLLGALFFRGLYLTGAASGHARRVMDAGLQIDLLNIERLYPWGRAAARTALIWFTVSASSLLLFVGSTFAPYLLVMLIGCAGMGVWVFVGTLGGIHKAIRKAKAAELETVRTEVARARAALPDDPSVAASLTGLLAYEARIAAAPEWPFDQTTVVRLAVSSLILTAPWFGQAVVALVVERLGRGLH